MRRCGITPWRVAAPLLLALALLAGICLGETRIPPARVLAVLGDRLFGMDLAVDPIDAGIIWSYRLTRALVAAACGAGLAVSGVILQTLMRNPLADPYLLGLSAGASTGAVLVSITGVGAGLWAGGLPMSAGAFLGALAAFGLVVALARAAGGRGLEAGPVILAGIAGAQLFNALTAYVIARSANAEQARGLMFWLMGNLSGVRWNDVALALPAVGLVLVVALRQTRALDAFAFGPEAAAALGVPVRRVQALLVLAAALATAVLVSIVGAVGFVGLVVPHAARLIVGGRHGVLMPAAALIGAVFLVAADVLSRVVLPGQVLPIGVVTALVGAPAFALVLVRRRGRA